jgi:thymidylate kinase
MYIEFIGMPGAGKTTLVEEVGKLLEREGIKCATRATFFPKNRTWKYKLLWMLLHPQYLDFSIAKLLFKLSRVRGSTFESMITRLHEHQKLQYQLAHQNDMIVLWDAGHIQRLSNIARMHILSNVAVTDLIYERIPKESLLIFVNTPVEVAITRMKEREPTRKVDGLQKLLTQTQQAQQNIFASLSVKGIATEKIDGTKPPRDIASIVCERIKKQL